MCRGGVGSILVIFDVLDCYILYMCLLLFVYCRPVLKAPRPRGRQNRIFLKKILMFPTNIRATWGRRGWLGLPRDSYVHKANVAPGWSLDYMAYVRRPGGTDEHMGLRFIGSAWPTNVN
jgi:hypothetical protein